ncbi:MAG: hypothetical protein WDZ41_03455 [Candidatus Babeliales bacterium]
MKLMDCRLVHILQTYAGYQKTGVSLIEFDGASLLPFSAADDIGIYIFIPKLASLLQIPIQQTINLFFYGLVSAAWLIGLVGFFFYYQTLLPRLISFVGLTLICLFSLTIGDTYLFYTICPVALIPWSLYFSTKKMSPVSYLFFFLAGITIMFSHYARAHAGLASLFFISWLLITQKKYSLKKKTITLCLLLLGLYLPVIYVNYTYKNYNSFLKQNNITDPFIGITNHMLWHPIYAGLGFLSFKNTDNIRWGDSFAAQKAQSINPNAHYNTPAYEKVLKNEIIKLIKTNPTFIIATIFAKLGILLLYLVIFANIGLIVAFFYPKPWQIETAFWGAFVLSSAFPLLVLPITEYSLGFITFAALYGITSINKLLSNSS